MIAQDGSLLEQCKVDSQIQSSPHSLALTKLKT